MNENDEERIRVEYEKFIEVTRKHQTQRERQKKIALKKQPQADEPYYIDISQLDTLVQDNLVAIPDRGDDGSAAEKLIKMYGSREAYEKIRSMEMNIDDYFKRKCKELSPFYWPVIPINPRPYLSPAKK